MARPPAASRLALQMGSCCVPTRTLARGYAMPVHQVSANFSITELLFENVWKAFRENSNQS